MIRMTNQTTTDWGFREKSTKQTSRYLIYLANLFLNQNMQRLFRWKRISPPLKLETLMATFWVPETTKRPRCIMVSDKGSLIGNPAVCTARVVIKDRWLPPSNNTLTLTLLLSPLATACAVCKATLPTDPT